MKRKYAAIVLGVAITCTTAQAVTAEPGSQNHPFAIEQNQASGQNGMPCLLAEKRQFGYCRNG